MHYACPACKIKLADEPIKSLDICPSCGMQWGYDDAAGGSDTLRQKIYAQWYKVWLENGQNPLTLEQREQVHKSTHSSQ